MVNRSVIGFAFLALALFSAISSIAQADGESGNIICFYDDQEHPEFCDPDFYTQINATHWETNATHFTGCSITAGQHGICQCATQEICSNGCDAGGIVCEGQVAPISTYKIYGFVHEKNLTSPYGDLIDMANVLVTGTRGTETVTNQTIGSYFELNVASQGEYSLKFTMSGYLDNSTTAISPTAILYPVNIIMTLSESADNARFYGTVKNSTGSALEGVSVIIEDSDYSAQTDANGNYEITGITSGDYSVTYSLADYTPVSWAGTLSGNIEHNVTLEKTPPAESDSGFYGIVTNSSGDRLAGVSILVVVNGKRNITVTDENGAYKLNISGGIIKNGRAVITATKTDYNKTQSTIGVTVGQSGIRADLMMLHPNEKPKKEYDPTEIDVTGELPSDSCKYKEVAYKLNRMISCPSAFMGADETLSCGNGQVTTFKISKGEYASFETVDSNIHTTTNASSCSDGETYKENRTIYDDEGNPHTAECTLISTDCVARAYFCGEQVGDFSLSYEYKTPECTAWDSDGKCSTAVCGTAQTPLDNFVCVNNVSYFASNPTQLMPGCDKHCNASSIIPLAAGCYTDVPTLPNNYETQPIHTVYSVSPRKVQTTTNAVALKPGEYFTTIANFSDSYHPYYEGNTPEQNRYTNASITNFFRGTVQISQTIEYYVNRSNSNASIPGNLANRTISLSQCNLLMLGYGNHNGDLYCNWTYNDTEFGQHIFKLPVYETIGQGATPVTGDPENAVGVLSRGYGIVHRIFSNFSLASDPTNYNVTVVNVTPLQDLTSLVTSSAHQVDASTTPNFVMTVETRNVFNLREHAFNGKIWIRANSIDATKVTGFKLNVSRNDGGICALDAETDLVSCDVINGSATFNLSIDKPGKYSFTTTFNKGDSGSINPEFTMQIGVGDLMFHIDAPSAQMLNSSFPIVVALQDTSGNPVRGLSYKVLIRVEPNKGIIWTDNYSDAARFGINAISCTVSTLDGTCPINAMGLQLGDLTFNASCEFPGDCGNKNIAVGKATTTITSGHCWNVTVSPPVPGTLDAEYNVSINHSYTSQVNEVVANNLRIANSLIGWNSSTGKMDGNISMCLYGYKPVNVTVCTDGSGNGKFTDANGGSNPGILCVKAFGLTPQVDNETSDHLNFNGNQTDIGYMMQDNCTAGDNHCFRFPQLLWGWGFVGPEQTDPSWKISSIQPVYFNITPVMNDYISMPTYNMTNDTLMGKTGANITQNKSMNPFEIRGIDAMFTIEQSGHIVRYAYPDLNRTLPLVAKDRIEFTNPSSISGDQKGGFFITDTNGKNLADYKIGNSDTQGSMIASGLVPKTGYLVATRMNYVGEDLFYSDSQNVAPRSEYKPYGSAVDSEGKIYIVGIREDNGYGKNCREYYVVQVLNKDYSENASAYACLDNKDKGIVGKHLAYTALSNGDSVPIDRLDIAVSAEGGRIYVAAGADKLVALNYNKENITLANISMPLYTPCRELGSGCWETISTCTNPSGCMGATMSGSYELAYCGYNSETKKWEEKMVTTSSTNPTTTATNASWSAYLDSPEFDGANNENRIHQAVAVAYQNGYVFVVDRFSYVRNEAFGNGDNDHHNLCDESKIGGCDSCGTNVGGTYLAYRDAILQSSGCNYCAGYEPVTHTENWVLVFQETSTGSLALMNKFVIKGSIYQIADRDLINHATNADALPYDAAGGYGFNKTSNGLWAGIVLSGTTGISIDTSGRGWNYAPLNWDNSAQGMAPLRLMITDREDARVDGIYVDELFNIYFPLRFNNASLPDNENKSGIWKIPMLTGTHSFGTLEQVVSANSDPALKDPIDVFMTRDILRSTLPLGVYCEGCPDKSSYGAEICLRNYSAIANKFIMEGPSAFGTANATSNLTKPFVEQFYLNTTIDAVVNVTYVNPESSSGRIWGLATAKTPMISVIIEGGPFYLVFTTPYKPNKVAGYIQSTLIVSYDAYSSRVFVKHFVAMNNVTVLNSAEELAESDPNKMLMVNSSYRYNFTLWKNYPYGYEFITTSVENYENVSDLNAPEASVGVSPNKSHYDLDAVQFFDALKNPYYWAGYGNTSLDWYYLSEFVYTANASMPLPKNERCTGVFGVNLYCSFDTNNVPRLAIQPIHVSNNTQLMFYGVDQEDKVLTATANIVGSLTYSGTGASRVSTYENDSPTYPVTYSANGKWFKRIDGVVGSGGAFGDSIALVTDPTDYADIVGPLSPTSDQYDSSEPSMLNLLHPSSTQVNNPGAADMTTGGTPLTLKLQFTKSICCNHTKATWSAPVEYPNSYDSTPYCGDNTPEGKANLEELCATRNPTGGPSESNRKWTYSGGTCTFVNGAASSHCQDFGLECLCQKTVTETQTGVNIYPVQDTSICSMCTEGSDCENVDACNTQSFYTVNQPLYKASRSGMALVFSPASEITIIGLDAEKNLRTWSTSDELGVRDSSNNLTISGKWFGIYAVRIKDASNASLNILPVCTVDGYQGGGGAESTSTGTGVCAAYPAIAPINIPIFSDTYSTGNPLATLSGEERQLRVVSVIVNSDQFRTNSTAKVTILGTDASNKSITETVDLTGTAGYKLTASSKFSEIWDVRISNAKGETIKIQEVPPTPLDENAVCDLTLGSNCFAYGTVSVQPMKYETVSLQSKNGTTFYMSREHVTLKIMDKEVIGKHNASWIFYDRFNNSFTWVQPFNFQLPTTLTVDVSTERNETDTNKTRVCISARMEFQDITATSGIGANQPFGGATIKFYDNALPESTTEPTTSLLTPVYKIDSNGVGNQTCTCPASGCATPYGACTGDENCSASGTKCLEEVRCVTNNDCKDIGDEVCVAGDSIYGQSTMVCKNSGRCLASFGYVGNATTCTKTDIANNVNGCTQEGMTSICYDVCNSGTRTTFAAFDPSEEMEGYMSARGSKAYGSGGFGIDLGDIALWPIALLLAALFFRRRA